MRKIKIEKITEEVKKACIESNCILRKDVEACLIKSVKKESGLVKEVLGELIENSKIARKEMLPICQDTGITCAFIDLGENVLIEGGNLYEAINEGVRQGYQQGYLRKSIVADPIFRKNTGDNTPAIIHTDIVKGDKLKITIMPKGAGSENMSKVKNFEPNVHISEIEDFIIETVKTAGANVCPPVIVGLGIGGTLDYAIVIAKKALLRRIGSKNSSPYYAKLENILLEKINKTGIGPQGLGGKTTALAVHIETYPCHIASLPVAVNINCHAARMAQIVL